MKRYLAIAAAAFLATSSLAYAQSVSPDPGGGQQGATSESGNAPTPGQTQGEGQPSPGGGSRGADSAANPQIPAGGAADPSKDCKDDQAGQTGTSTSQGTPDNC